MSDPFETGDPPAAAYAVFKRILRENPGASRDYIFKLYCEAIDADPELHRLVMEWRAGEYSRDCLRERGH